MMDKTSEEGSSHCSSSGDGGGGRDSGCDMVAGAELTEF